MIGFITAVLGLALILVLLLWWPILRTSPIKNEEDLFLLNKRVFQERLQELQQDVDKQQIDAEIYQELKLELEKQLLSAHEQYQATQTAAPVRKHHALVAIFILLAISAGLLFYVYEQRDKALTQWWQTEATMLPTVQRLLQGQAPSESESKNHSVADFIHVLQVQLQRTPSDARGWFMLGMSYAQNEMVEPAITALERAYRLEPDNNRYAMALAQTKIFSNQGSLDTDSQHILEKLLLKDPNHEGALVLLGFSAYRSAQYDVAIPALEKLLQQHKTADSEQGRNLLKQLRTALADAQSKQKQIQKVADNVLKITVSLNKKLLADVNPNDVVFISARELNGPSMPLAAQKHRVAELPLQINLSDADSLMPSRPLSSVANVIISARVSKSGTPMPSTGDLEAQSVPVKLNGGAQTMDLEINQRRP